MVNPNSKLLCELSEKLATKYLLQFRNNFSELIQQRFTVVDNKLIIVNMPEYLVSEVHAKNGFFIYKGDRPNSINSFLSIDKS